jgi:hypothetical protein
MKRPKPLPTYKPAEKQPYRIYRLSRSGDLYNPSSIPKETKSDRLKRKKEAISWLVAAQNL